MDTFRNIIFLLATVINVSNVSPKEVSVELMDAIQAPHESTSSKYNEMVYSSGMFGLLG